MKKLPKTNHHDKKKLSKKELLFLEYYSIEPIKYKAMEKAGFVRTDGTCYTQEYLTNKASEILKTEIAKEYIKRVHKEIFDSNCFSLEKAINEAYENYTMLKQKEKYHEMNISFDTFLKVSGLLKPQVAVQQQFVTDKEGGITINYVQNSAESTGKKEDNNSGKIN